MKSRFTAAAIMMVCLFFASSGVWATQEFVSLLAGGTAGVYFPLGGEFVTRNEISSGYIRLGATIVDERICETFARSKRSTLFLGHTYSGNPLSCVEGLAVLRYIK
jgi:hypothetical protein